MPFTTIGENAYIEKAVVAQNCEIGSGTKIVSTDNSVIVVPEGEVVLAENSNKQVGWYLLNDLIGVDNIENGNGYYWSSGKR